MGHWHIVLSGAVFTACAPLRPRTGESVPDSLGSLTRVPRPTRSTSRCKPVRSSAPGRGQ
jgi:hypothetical protein